MKAADLRELTAAELAEKLGETKEELFNLRFQLATNQLDNVARVGQLRRDVARIETIMREQELEAWALSTAASSVTSGSDKESE
jgi:large subunit ribosomal protein L29